MNKTEALVQSFEARRRVLAYHRELKRVEADYARRDPEEIRIAQCEESQRARFED